MLYTTDKVGHGYQPTYEQLAMSLGRSIHPAVSCSVLEVGIGDGAGLRFFQDIFGGPVVGVDNDRPRITACADAGFTVIEADQREPSTIVARLGATIGVPAAFDVIVDDASHQAGPTFLTFIALWQAVKPGGYYVVEDYNHLDHEVLHRLINGTALWAPPGSPQLAQDVEFLMVRPEGLAIFRKARSVAAEAL